MPGRGVNEFGPSRGELRLRLWLSLAGLGLLGAALIVVPRPWGPAVFEALLIAGGFFGGTAVWSGRRLWSARKADRGMQSPPRATF